MRSQWKALRHHSLALLGRRGDTPIRPAHEKPMERAPPSLIGISWTSAERSPPLLHARQIHGFPPSSSTMDSIPSPYPVLKFLNEFAELHKTHNHLPHWQQDQATYFLTFRLGDSIPAELLKQWKHERDHWMLNHPKPWSPETEAEHHKNFSSRIDQHLDQGHGSCLFRDAENAGIVAGAFRHFIKAAIFCTHGS